ncbi:SDR family NAD(P)-dependent oxidoreductase [Aeromicrobium wangtongii]|uniref:SDR family NAD(P)-dependent oxidoreductase n=1 Tax=Aeromicrobium wangtongii TaxID=2969247 RepID=UPI002017489B|nr:glucose 1-dehydrogenase [Aeromicrobium wangtongii]MCL3818601.1 glucose 1-dehydrogenase [Aeromicrobium wangtongii]
MSRFDGRVAIITGGGSGLGREFSCELAKDGARVVVADIFLEGAEETVALVEAQGGTSVAVQADVSQSGSVQAMVHSALDAYGAIDILINNAGLVGETLPAAEVSEESWDRVMSVDMKGVFLGSKAVIPIMLEKGSGVIINIASVSGFLASATGIEYTAAKHGVVGLTKQLAYDYGHQGIRAVGVAPGVIETPLTADWTKEGGPFHELTMDAPAARYGRPIDIARFISFLASDEASFMHGHTYPVDGGSIIR